MKKAVISTLVMAWAGIAGMERSALALDAVKWKNAQGQVITTQGTVVRDDKNGVQLSENVTISQAQVVEIIYSEWPQGYDYAIPAYKGKQWEEAYRRFDRMRIASNRRPIFLQYKLYYMADCKFQLGDWAKAAEEFEKLLQEVPENKFINECHYYRARAYLNAGQAAKAGEAAQALIRTSGPWTSAGKLVLAASAEKANNNAQAKTLYTEIANAKSAPSFIRADGCVGAARTSGDDAAMAVQMAMRATTEFDEDDLSPATLSEAYMILGTRRCERTSAGNDDLLAGVMAFLHVPEIPSATAEASAEALCRAVEALTRINEPDAEKAKEIRRLAVRLQKQCTSDFKGSPWAVKAGKIRIK